MNFKVKPFKHQLDCFERNKRLKYYAYLMEMGTGKSKILLDTAAYLYQEDIINAVMIFANKGSYSNWVEHEIPEHLCEDIEAEVYIWRTNMTMTQRVEFSKRIEKTNKLKIFVMNIEGLAYERSFKIAYEFVKMNKTLTAIDESTTIKNYKAKRTKSAWKIGKASIVRRIMTGSVVDNRPLDAFAQFQFLANGCLGFTSYFAFRNQYAELEDMTTRNSPRSFKVVKGYKNINHLKSSMAKYAFIIKKDECLDLPPKIYQKYYIELTDEQKKMYEQLVKKSVTEINEEIVSVKIVLTKLLKLHQLVCGHVTDDEGKVHNIKHNRIDTLMNILDETSGQVIIWANYRSDIQAIYSTIKKEYGPNSVLTYYGDTNEQERNKAKEVFKRGNDIKGVRFMVGNPQTGGYGITLTGANTVIYYSNNFDAEKRNQSEDRAHRIGQTAKVTYIDLICKGTIDEKILKALKAKKNLSEELTTSNWLNFFN